VGQDAPPYVANQCIARQAGKPLGALWAEIGFHATNSGHAALNLKEIRKENPKRIRKKNLAHPSIINENC